jgi:putative sporulation protein YtaF
MLTPQRERSERSGSSSPLDIVKPSLPGTGLQRGKSRDTNETGGCVARSSALNTRRDLRLRFLAILGIALANNLDNTGVGIAFGIARIRLSPLMNLWIALVTFVITGLAVACGGRVAAFLSLPLAHAFGGTLLCAIGGWMVVASLRSQNGRKPESDPEGPVSLQRILADPTSADQNRSHDIDLREATVLGVALSLNNVGGGFSAGLVHMSALWTALFSAVISFLVLWFGGWAGTQLGVTRVGKHAQTIAGTLLLIIGLYEFH